jgi:hypothetical protein
VFHYGLHLTSFLNPLGMPCWKPPYGTLSSYDLKTGKLLWNEPFGEVQKWGLEADPGQRAPAVAFRRPALTRVQDACLRIIEMAPAINANTASIISPPATASTK